MKKSIRRAAVGVSVTYSDGGFSNNLMGSSIEVDALPDFLCVSIDLARNIHVRNKRANCFDDGCQLAERYAKLGSVQIDDRQVLERLTAVFKRFPRTKWQIELSLGEKGTFKYLTRPRMLTGGIIFDLLSVV